MIPEGSYTARCTHVLNIGVQGKMPTVLIGWELPEVLEDGKPVLVFKEFHFSYSRYSTLRSRLEDWRGRKFTDIELQQFALENVLDTCCTLMISNEPRFIAIVKLQVGTVLHPRVHDLVHYDFEQGRNLEFDLLPLWIQEKIENCQEWKHPPIPQEIPDDVIP